MVEQRANEAEQEKFGEENEGRYQVVRTDGARAKELTPRDPSNIRAAERHFSPVTVYPQNTGGLVFWCESQA